MNEFAFRISSFPFVTVRMAEHTCLVSFSWGPDSLSAGGHTGGFFTLAFDEPI